jgi:hypothetical protein
LQGAETAIAAAPPIAIAKPQQNYFVPIALLSGLMGLAVLIAASLLWEKWFPRQSTTSRDGAIPSISVPPGGAVVQSEFPPGVWTNVLKREPLPLIMSSNDRQAWTTNDLMVSAEHPTLLQFGETTAKQFSLRIVVHEDAWDSDGGIFLGYSAEPLRPQVDQVVLVSVSKQEDDRLTLHLRKAEFQHQGVQHPQLLAQKAFIPTNLQRPTNDRVTIQVDVSRGSIRSCFVNSQPVTLPESAELSQLSTSGKFGVFVFGKTCRFSSAEIRVNE